VKKLPVGTKIICPSCKALIAILKRDIRSGDRVRAEYFAEKIPGAVAPHAPMRCPHDGSYYGRTQNGTGQLHTEQGWM
jgi:hypothetical protein